MATIAMRAGRAPRTARTKEIRRTALIYLGLTPFLVIAVFPIFWMVITAIKQKLYVEQGIDLPYPARQILFHDQTEATDGDRRRQREGWPAGTGPVPAPRTIAGAIKQLPRAQAHRDEPIAAENVGDRDGM